MLRLLRRLRKSALDRGEIQAMTLALGSMYLTSPQLFKPGAVSFPFQIGFEREPEWADARTLIEMAQKPEDRRLFEVMSVNMEIGRSFWVGPGVPEDRLKVPRTAFESVLKDSDFLTEFKKQNMLARFKSGADMDGYIKRLFDAPDSVIERLNDVMPKK